MALLAIPLLLLVMCNGGVAQAVQVARVTSIAIGASARVETTAATRVVWKGEAVATGEMAGGPETSVTPAVSPYPVGRANTVTEGDLYLELDLEERSSLDSIQAGRLTIRWRAPGNFLTAACIGIQEGGLTGQHGVTVRVNVGQDQVNRIEAIYEPEQSCS